MPPKLEDAHKSRRDGMEKRMAGRGNGSYPAVWPRGARTVDIKPLTQAVDEATTAAELAAQRCEM